MSAAVDHVTAALRAKDAADARAYTVKDRAIDNARRAVEKDPDLLTDELVDHPDLLDMLASIVQARDLMGLSSSARSREANKLFDKLRSDAMRRLIDEELEAHGYLPTSDEEVFE